MLDLNPDFKKALDIVTNTRKNLFLTGKAGTGKSTFLRHLIQNLAKKKVTLAPTGLAAINIGGQTIHSFFKLPPGGNMVDAKKAGQKLKDDKLIQNLEMLIVDEVSMVRADLLDMMDMVLKTARSQLKPFGGVQMVLIGDLYQLPPVIRGDEAKLLKELYITPYFFSANVFEYLLENLGSDLEFVELNKIYRQNDPAFINLLNQIRYRDITAEELEKLNQKLDLNWQNLANDYIILTTRNDQANNLNQQRLEQLQTKTQIFEGEIEGDFNPNNLPTELELKLKVGARVMFVKNDLYGKWVNGTLGTVQKIKKDQVEVLTDEGQNVQVEAEEWEVFQASFDNQNNTIVNQVVGKFSQIPLRLSWAITIHKSQGQTFSKVILDLGRGAFSTGQTYVALSRCTSLDGLVLASPIRLSDIRTDYKVSKFLTNLQYQLAHQNLSLEDKITKIETAIKKKQTLEIVYLKAKNVRDKRKIKPTLLEKRNYKGIEFLAVEGFCLLRQADRVFNVERILEIKEEN